MTHADEKQLYPILPLRAEVPLPGVVLPLEVGRARSLRAVAGARADDDHILLVPQKSADTADPGADELLEVGLVARIIQTIEHGPTHHTVLVNVIKRVHIIEVIRGGDFYVARTEPFAEVDYDETTIEPLMAEVLENLTPIMATETPSEENVAEIVELEDPDDLVHLAAQHVELTRDDLIEILLEPDPEQRLFRILPAVEHMREVLRVGADIRHHLNEETKREAREHVLRDRMRAIRAELGEDDEEAELTELLEKVAESKMSDEAREETKREIDHMRHMASDSPSYTVSKTYVESMLEVPWGTYTKDTLDVAAARAILDADHCGLQKVKKRILEFIAVRKLAPNKQGPILCLVGPPGVGKTSLGRAIAQALNRKYVRAALGGVRDESEIRGHRRTYIGALPGRIAKQLMKAKSMNPVFVLDEVDKLGADQHGDPTSALLEVLDPEQNSEFVDHYLAVPIDLSQVMFIATANRLDTIPPALLDRMEIIEVPSYTSEEKNEIARKHLLPKQMAEHGLEKSVLTVTDEALDEIVAHYTREAGVRNLERQLAAICRAVAVDVANGRAAPRTVDADGISEILGTQKFHKDAAARQPEVGVGTGMAWTPVGGTILFIESREMPGKGELRLTGQVGDVMHESALAALSYVRSNSERLGIDPGRFEKNDIHVHIPAGGIKKDGPSAGVVIATSLVSLLTGKPIRNDVAITGEITLRGIVLPVGGIKEKVLAAHRAGIRTVLLPKRNAKDLVDIPESVRDALDIRLIERVDDALEVAMGDGDSSSAGDPGEPPIPPPGNPNTPNEGDQTNWSAN